MSDITVTKLQDVLNDIERNAYEGILGSEEITRAYVLAGELGENIEKLKAENAKLWEQVMQLKVNWEEERDYADLMEAKEIQAVAENEKLRKKINALRAHGIEIVDAVAGGYEIYDIQQREVDRLEVENGKLRELASEAHSCKTNDGCCEDCYCDEGCCPIERRMQELGIEVDA